MTLSDDDRAQIRARAEAATPGPWENPLHRTIGEGGWWVEHPKAHSLPSSRYRQIKADAAHIAGMDPATTLALLDERDNLAAEVKRLRGDLLVVTWDHAEARVDADEAYTRMQERYGSVSAELDEATARALTAEAKVAAGLAVADDMAARGWRFEAEKVRAVLRGEAR